MRKTFLILFRLIIYFVNVQLSFHFILFEILIFFAKMLLYYITQEKTGKQVLMPFSKEERAHHSQFLSNKFFHSYFYT